MKKMIVWASHVFAGVSALSVVGILKGGMIYEPIPPQLREEQAQKEAK
jgi:hypothetical protein